MAAPWTIRVARDGRRVDDAEPLLATDRLVEVLHVPDEGEAAFDACVDALIGAFHMPEDHAAKVAATVLDVVRGHRG